MVPQLVSIRKQSLQLAFTIIIIIFIIVTIYIFRRLGSLTPQQKQTYLGLTTGLSLLLGLNFFDTFKTLARASPARLEYYTGLDAKKLNNIEDWSTILSLVREGIFSHRTIALCCIVWTCFFLGAQTTIALLNVEVQVVDGTNYNDTYTQAGTVRVPDLSCYWHYVYDARHYQCGLNSSDVSAQATTQVIAHDFGANGYGALTPSSDCGNYTDISQVLASTWDHRYYCRRNADRPEFAFRFNEYNTDDNQSTYPYLTDRTITASSGPCTVYNQTSRRLLQLADGTKAVWNYTYRSLNGSITGSIIIPVQNEALSGTTYVYRGAKVPQNATTWACGNRCINMWAHKSPVPYGDRSSLFYQCPITVGYVGNATQSAHYISDGIARLAASSIALQGRNQDGTDKWAQYQLYPIGSPWDVHHKPTKEVGANMAEFAIASISTMSQQNKQIEIPGNVPYLGSRVIFEDWGQVLGLLLPVAGAHFLLFVLIIDADRYNRSHLGVVNEASHGEEGEELGNQNPPYNLVQGSSEQNTRYERVRSTALRDAASGQADMGGQGTLGSLHSRQQMVA